MQVKTISYEGVKEDGTFESKKGAIHTTRGINYGAPCSCGCSPEHYITVNSGRTSEGTLTVVSITGTEEELDKVYPLVLEVYEALK